MLLLSLMAPEQDRILLVESDPVICDLVARQTLQAAGYQVAVVTDANAAITRAVEFAPDLILTELSLPGLSGKDLLVALASQNVDAPVILLAKKGMESEIIHSIRLGAADYLEWPAREAEILTVVERILNGVRDTREREQAVEHLQQQNLEIRQQLSAAAMLLELGKELTATTDLDNLSNRMLEKIIRAVKADFGWLLIKDENSKAFVLAAQQHLPASLPVQINQPWDDGISSMVAVSGEPLIMHGDQLKRFKLYAVGRSALIFPLKVSGSVAGLLALMRSEPVPFSTSDQRTALTAVEFAAIALANIRHVHSASERTRQQEQAASTAMINERISNELLTNIKRELSTAVESQDTALKNLNENLARQLSQYQRDQLDQIQASLSNLSQVNEVLASPKFTRAQRPQKRINLNDISLRTVGLYLPLSLTKEISLGAVLPDQPVYILADEDWLSQALAGLVSNAVKYCDPGGSVRVALSSPAENVAQLTITNSGQAIEPELLGKIFSGIHSENILPQRPGGLAIGLTLIKDLISRMNGKIWVENKPGTGVQFQVVFPTH